MHALSGIIPSPVLGIPTWTYRRTESGEDPRGAFAIPLELPLLEPALAAASWPLLGPVQQLNVSVSNVPLTARGLHVSNTGKICFVMAGSFTCAVVNLRSQDHTFGQVDQFDVDADAGVAFYVPPGFGNALMNHGVGDMYAYFLDGVFNPSAERVVAMSSVPTIRWPQVPQLISAKDRAGLTLEEYIAQSR